MTSNDIDWPKPAIEPRKPAFMLKKMMAQYVYDITWLEGNPLSFVQVQSLLDGARIADADAGDMVQAMNQHATLKHLAASLGEPWDGALARALHARIAREEALVWGEFRNSDVGISGTRHKPPAAASLQPIWDDGMACLQTIEHPVERALLYHFWAARNQFFFDGNKRCARAMMNHALLTHGYYYLSVPAKAAEEYDQMMVATYDSGDVSTGLRWMLQHYVNWD
ncbi:MAG: hypothetical protein RL748_113 [Pseudomonadota bacterium]